MIPKDSTADLQKGQSFAIVWQIVRQFAGWTRGDRVGACGEFRRVIRQWYIILSFKDVPKSEVLRAARVPRTRYAPDLCPRKQTALQRSGSPEGHPRHPFSALKGCWTLLARVLGDAPHHGRGQASKTSFLSVSLTFHVRSALLRDGSCFNAQDGPDTSS